PYVSKASARDQGCGGVVGIARSGPPGVPVAREPGTIEEHGEASTPSPVELQRHPCDAGTGRDSPARIVQISRIASRTCSTCPSPFTVGHSRATLPEPSIRNVERLMPMNLRP